MGLVIFPPSLLQSKTQRTTIQQSFSGALAKRGQRSTMGKKIFREILVLTRNRPYGVRPYVRPPIHVSRGEILHFKYTRVSAVNRIATRTLRDKKQQQRSRIFHSTQFNVYIGEDNRERARDRDKKQRRPISFEEKHENFIAAVRKREMLAATKVKKSGSEKKKANRMAYNICSIKRVTRKFLEVSRCRRAKQRQRNLQKRCAARAKFFFAN